MTDRQQLLRTIAAGTAVKQIADEAINAAKKELQADLPRGTEYLYTSADPETREELGYATVPKPSQPKPKPELRDEEILPWLLEENEDAVEVRYVIKDWARKDLEAAALAAHKAGVPQKPGIDVVVPAARPASARFTPSKDLVPLVRGMWQAGELDLVDVLALEVRPEPGEAA